MRHRHGSQQVRLISRVVLVVVLFASCAGLLREPSELAEPTEHDRLRLESWVNETLGQMSLRRQIGQMLFARAFGRFANEKAPSVVSLQTLASKGVIGGVVFFQGTPHDTASLVNRLQDRAPVPLLMAADFEWGAAFRIRGASRFPSAMAIGAGRNLEAARLQAEVTAREARALGIQWVLAPVLDLNLSPANSVINYRSYGEDPDSVSRLGVAFIRRLQEQGLLATAKHFPGHGATPLDSHLVLPVLRRDKSELEQEELVPFRAAIEAGVASVMPGHLAVPAFDGRSDRPATFSRQILHGLLREELGFEGLIASDAMDMGAVRERWWHGAAAVAAVQAGCDVLLLPPEPLVALRAIEGAVERGEISREQIEQSARRILQAKARVNLHRRRNADLRDVPRFVAEPRFEPHIQAMADRAVTLLEQKDELLPLSAITPPRTLLVTYLPNGDRRVEAEVLAEELEKRTEKLDVIVVDDERLPARRDEVERLASQAELVVVASYARTRSEQGRGELAGPLRRLLKDGFGGSAPVVLASLGNPYVLAEAPEVAARITTYDFAPASQLAMARALFGEIAVQGKLPVRLSEDYPLGHGLEVARRSTELEPIDSLQEAGFSRQGMARVVSVLRDAVRSRAFPGVTAIVGRHGKIALARAFGHLSYDNDSPEVTLDTLYDLASLTKVIATTTASMMLYDQGKLELDRPVHDYIPEFVGEDKDSVTVADLLAHSGGLLWWKDLYKEFGELPPERARKRYVETIAAMPLDYPPRSKTSYSDLGIILLGEILERVTGQSLEDIFEARIFEPLGMVNTRFRPPVSLLPRIAPTEIDPWRHRLVHGEVHDENAFALGGIAPHAGLFSTAGDVARFAQMMLNGGVYAHRRLVKRSTIELFTQRAGLAPNSSRAVGWDTPSGKSSAGRFFSSSSFGHTGFTGNSLWIDPERGAFAVLLSNRVHPTRENEQIREVRPAFHDAIMEAIVDMELAPREGSRP